MLLFILFFINFIRTPKFEKNQASLYGPRPATPHHRVYSPGKVARGGQAFSSGQSSPYAPATVSPPRAPPKAWAALARGTDSSPSNVPLRTDSPNPVAGSEVAGDAT